MRVYAAALIAEISLKYSTISPGLSSRICNTYVEAISQSKSLIVMFGGIIGLGALGIAAVESVLLERVGLIENALKLAADKLLEVKKTAKTENFHEQQLAIIKCKEALLIGFGKFLVEGSCRVSVNCTDCRTICNISHAIAVVPLEATGNSATK